MLRTPTQLSLPADVLSFEGERFFELVHQTCGNAFKELMEVLSINTVQKLLLTEKEILPVFQKNYRELKKITEQACLHLDDGTLLLKPGLRLDFDRFINTLHAVDDSRKKSASSSIEEMLSSLKESIKSSQLNGNNDSSRGYVFLTAFLENIFNNLLKNKNNYRYSETVQTFAQSLYVLGGRNAYEFVRLNLPGSLPSIPTLDESLERAGATIEEGKFQYDPLRDHQKSFGYEIAVCSEDSTAVIKRVSYTVSTNSFTGFSTPLKNGIPIARHFQTDYFDQLKTWFENQDKGNF